MWNSYVDKQSADFKVGDDFKSSITIIAALNKLIHNSIILKHNLPNYRLEQVITPNKKVGYKSIHGKQDE